ncbi:hypothetical protein GCM10020000_02230 [Streptomyces olivoverticillatus]
MSVDAGVEVRRLLAMPQSELDRLFRESLPGEIPRGEGIGTVLLARGARISGVVAKVAYCLAWQGKVFDSGRNELSNSVTPLRVRAIKAEVYRDKSWLDGGECIVLDYSRTSVLAHRIRDEIRRIGPGSYLGNVYWGRRRILNFSLRFPGPHA